MLHKYLFDLIWNKKDQLIIDVNYVIKFKIPIDMPETPIVFGIIRKRQLKSFVEKIPDFKNLGCRKFFVQDLSD